MSLGVLPASVYKGSKGGCGRPGEGAPGGVLLLVGVGLLLGGGKKWGGRRKGGRRPPLLVQFGPGGGGARPTFGCPSLSPLRPIWPITSPGGVPVTLRLSGFLRNHPEHFWCPNIVVQYINLYVSNISRLLIMSVITSETPNKLRYIKMHKLII